MKSTRFHQCHLVKNVGDGKTLQTMSWIPEKFCRVGKILKLKNPDGTWDDNWVVFWVSENFLSEEGFDFS